MPGRNFITSFLQAHRHSIQEASLTADELVIDLKPDVSSRDVLVFFADLITYVAPVKATLHNDKHNDRIRLELGS